VSGGRQIPRPGPWQSQLPRKCLSATGKEPHTRGAEPAAATSRNIPPPAQAPSWGWMARAGLDSDKKLRNVHFMFDRNPPHARRFGPDQNRPVAPGVLLARGVCRHLRGHDFATLTEFPPQSGLRVDVMALGPKGEIWVIECKSSPTDFHADRKWRGYLPWCDRFFWAVDIHFPTELLPEDTGLIIADGYDGDIQRMGPLRALASARRTALTRRFARHAAHRLGARHSGWAGLDLDFEPPPSSSSSGPRGYF
jgi:hypothetical protein